MKHTYENVKTVVRPPKLAPFSGRVSSYYVDRYEAITIFRRSGYFDIKGAIERPGEEGRSVFWNSLRSLSRKRIRPINGPRPIPRCP